MSSSRSACLALVEDPTSEGRTLANIPVRSSKLRGPRKDEVSRVDQMGSLQHQQHAILTGVFKNLAIGVIVCDTDGHFVCVSQEAERILGIGATHAESAK